jgi:Tol biopolymer transport system component
LATAENRIGGGSVWQIDLVHGASPARFTFDSGGASFPLWWPDGKQIVFTAARAIRLHRKAAAGTGSEEELPAQSGNPEFAYDWSRDGRYLLYGESALATALDLYVLPMTGEDRKPAPFAQTSADELEGQFSPDGRWIAYVSNESGRFEIYVRSFNGPGGKFLISSEGGIQPHWRGDGKELYYLSLSGKIMAVMVRAAADSFERETPRALFETRIADAINTYFTYDVTRDGQRFAALVEPEEAGAQPLTMLTNWQARLAK